MYGQFNQHTKQQIVVNEEFIYEIADAKTPQCHASTIAEAGNVLVAAWFGGTKEKNKDVGIWVSRKINGKWSVPLEVVNGKQADGSRFPCWNPVLFQPKSGKLFLFYKVGPNPREWWGMYVTSEDNGENWSEPIKLPKGIYGPIKNKPVELSNGDIISPTSTEHDGWKVQVERSSDLGKTWKSSGDLNDTSKYHAIQPTILVHSNTTLQMLCRTKNSVITELWSYDNGYTWSLMVTTGLPNPNSGIDAVSLKDGRYLLVGNPTRVGNISDNITLIDLNTFSVSQIPTQSDFPAGIAVFNKYKKPVPQQVPIFDPIGLAGMILLLGTLAFIRLRRYN